MEGLAKTGISLYLQGTLDSLINNLFFIRYIPVPTGNSSDLLAPINFLTVYPCTYRELVVVAYFRFFDAGISLYLQGTPLPATLNVKGIRYIPVPTGNSDIKISLFLYFAVYPCTYRELFLVIFVGVFSCGISLYLQGTPRHASASVIFKRYIPVPTGNSIILILVKFIRSVYPCTYREL